MITKHPYPNMKGTGHMPPDARAKARADRAARRLHAEGLAKAEERAKALGDSVKPVVRPKPPRAD
jgi:hypothetical protein